MITINSVFDGGNIELLSAERADAIRVNIRPDQQSEFYQWFYFRVSGVAAQQTQVTIENAGGSAYQKGWQAYRAVASYDREHWFRVPTQFEQGQLTISLTPEQDSVYLAYFAPYSMERHADLIASAQRSALVEASVIGTSLDGQTMDLLQVGKPGEGKRALWVIARQHPGETMAEWWMEGFLQRLLDEADPVAKALLNKAVFYLVPNMNPDGSRRGHLRMNACGANLNREWRDASLERSPEVYWVRQKMKQVGVDFCLDVHGDEGLPYNFIAAAEGIPSWNAIHQQRLDSYQASLLAASPDFQTQHGYDKDAPGEADLRICTNYIAETFGCLAMTLEMPFKDTADTPDHEQGWSPERSMLLGEANLNAMLAVIDQL